jgi:hypothetical protein
MEGATLVVVEEVVAVVVVAEVVAVVVEVAEDKPSTAKMGHPIPFGWPKLIILRLFESWYY